MLIKLEKQHDEISQKLAKTQAPNNQLPNDEKSVSCVQTDNNLGEHTIYDAPNQQARHNNIQQFKHNWNKQEKVDQITLDRNYISIGDTIYRVILPNQELQVLPQGVLPIYYHKDQQAYIGFSHQLCFTQQSIKSWIKVINNGFIKSNAQGGYGVKNLGGLVEAVDPNLNDRLYTQSFMTLDKNKIYIFNQIANHQKITTINQQQTQMIPDDGTVVKFLTIAEVKQIEISENAQKINNNIANCAIEFNPDAQSFVEINNAFAQNMKTLAINQQKNLQGSGYRTIIDEIMSYKSKSDDQKHYLQDQLQHLADMEAQLAGLQKQPQQDSL